MTMRHTQIQPRSMMSELMIAPQPDRRAGDRLRLDGSLRLEYSRRREDMGSHARVIQTDYKGQIREPIWVDHFAPRNGVAAALNHSYNTSNNNLSDYSSSQQQQQLHSSIGKYGPPPAFKGRSTTPSATSSRQSSRNSSFSNNMNNNTNHAGEAAALQHQSNSLLLNTSTGSASMKRSVTPGATRRLNATTFGDKSNLYSPRAADADFARTNGSIHNLRQNTIKQPSECLGGSKQSVHWTYSLRNEAIQFKNKKPPPGFRGVGKPRVLPPPKSKEGSEAGGD